MKHLYKASGHDKKKTFSLSPKNKQKDSDPSRGHSCTINGDVRSDMFGCEHARPRANVSFSPGQSSVRKRVTHSRGRVRVNVMRMLFIDLVGECRAHDEHAYTRGGAATVIIYHRRSHNDVLSRPSDPNVFFFRPRTYGKMSA